MAPSTTRRHLIATIPFVTLGAGCMGSLPFRDEPASPRVGLGKISVFNSREAPTTADITVLRDGRSVYEQSHTLEGREGNRVDMVEVVESWMGQNVTYEVAVTARNPRVEATFSTSDAEQLVEDWGDDECFQVHFDITSEEIPTAFGGLNTCQLSSPDSTGSGDRPTLRR
ncbi:hypothetical protein SAMN04487950_0109 [Halogranum rubrum]|uniref:Lipoprotein n=1 Tax=Halogranum rubrum TaxID=553466 RepID=A0A1I4AVR0_9EURY|nr:hypothetical protein [Halogranum rubrum]SFK59961.1 hypothetical protein SAMN04487950_0109 [Halogranum rubrum]